MEKANFHKIFRMLKILTERAKTREGKQKVEMEFNEKLKASKGIDGLINKLRVMYRYFMDPEVPIYKKAIIGAILLYFINPMDVIPDIVPVGGFIDDTVLILYGWNLLKGELDKYIDAKRSGVVNEDGEVISDVDYTVDESKSDESR